jgi:hypothetical protein
MKSLKTLVSLSALAVCMGAASMANAFSISPKHSFSTTARYHHHDFAVVLWRCVNVRCDFTGNVDATGAAISPACLTGGGLCSLKNITRLGVELPPGATSGSVTNVGYTIAGSLIVPAPPGPSTIAVAYQRWVVDGLQPAPKQSCTVVSLSVKALR